jgi:hypothetical protein
MCFSEHNDRADTSRYFENGSDDMSSILYYFEEKFSLQLKTRSIAKLAKST